MSTLTFTLKQSPAEVLDLSGLIPSKLAGLSQAEISALPVSNSGLKVGDVFDVTGGASDTLVINQCSNLCDNVAAGLDGGTVIVEGDVGNYAAAKMRGGKFEIRGNAADFVASGLKAGLVTISGTAGDFAGGLMPGDKFGMLGGIVVVEGHVGARAGERMRRGTIVTRASFGPAAGSRMCGGTLWTEVGFGNGPGPLLRRGTLIGPKADGILPSFSDCGRHDQNVLKILSKYMTETLGPLAPKPLPEQVQKIAGDFATIGKGELLLTA